MIGVMILIKKFTMIFLLFSLKLLASEHNNYIDLNQYRWHLLISLIVIFCLKVLAFFLYRYKLLKEMKKRISELQLELDKKNAELDQLASNDILTGLYNRRTMNDKIKEEVLRNKRYETPFSILIIDIDFFRDINNEFGGYVADEVLKNVGILVNENTRAVDISARWDGEEFLILASNTKLSSALALGEKLRKIIYKHNFEKVNHITVSIGVSEYNKGEKYEELSKRAEEALVKAKELGRNQVCFKDYPRDIDSVIEELLLEWSNNYLSGNQVLDKQHKELFDLSNKLVRTILEKKDYVKIEKILEEIKIKSKTHFECEELEMKESEYTDFSKHKESHFNLLFQMEKHMIKYKLGELSNVDLLKFVSKKLISEHILKEDKSYFKYMNNKFENKEEGY